MLINDKSSWFESELEKLEKDSDALAYKYILDFSEDVLAALDRKGIKNKNKYLAKKLGVSPAYISKLFNGRTNFTVKKLVEISKAIDCELKLYLQTKLVVLKEAEVYSVSVSESGELVSIPAKSSSSSFSISANQETINPVLDPKAA